MRGPTRALAKLIGRGAWNRDAAQIAAVERLQQVHDGQLHGLYLHGSVGSGKTAMMDLLVECSREAQRVKRLHFHEFMLYAHAEMHKGRTPMEIGRQVADADLLCLDEFELTDIADAAIVSRAMRGILSTSCSLVTTSNRPPGAGVLTLPP